MLDIGSALSEYTIIQNKINNGFKKRSVTAVLPILMAQSQKIIIIVIEGLVFWRN
jgi:hypothetical protein